jgi:hypothetical protein
MGGVFDGTALEPRPLLDRLPSRAPAGAQASPRAASQKRSSSLARGRKPVIEMREGHDVKTAGLVELAQEVGERDRVGSSRKRNDRPSLGVSSR